MLVSFSVENFRSFAEKQTISLVAGTGARGKPRFSFSSANAMAPDLLRSACVFGPNAAGKSALVKAFYFFKNFVETSAQGAQAGDKIEVPPFKFDKEWRGQPSEFEAVFIHQGALYQYGFAVDEERVWGEWLFSKPNTADSRLRMFFQREYDPDTEEYDWQINPTHVKGEREVWRKSTRDNALFLSTAIQLNAKVFKSPFEWIKNYLRVLGSPEGLPQGFTAQQCTDEGLTSRVMGILESVDLGIKDIDVQVEKVDLSELPKELIDILPKTEQKKFKDGEIHRFEVTSYHQDRDESLVPIDFDEESDGTRVLFNLAGPWLDVLANGYTLVIDELHNSLHPHALKFLVDLFHNPENNKNNAQLIFTSHETSVMAKEFMHKDQVWLVEKDKWGASQLVPLSDYKVRDVAAFQKSYLDGRYGAVPKIRELVDGGP